MQVQCQAPNCGVVFEAKRASAKCCSARCRQRLSRAPKATPSGGERAKVIDLPAPPPAAPAGTAPGVHSVTLAALEAADRVATPIGQAVLVLALRLDNAGQETGAGLAAVEKSFRAAYAEAMAGVEKDEDELDGLRFEAFSVIAGGRV